MRYYWSDICSYFPAGSHYEKQNLRKIASKRNEQTTRQKYDQLCSKTNPLIIRIHAPTMFVHSEQLSEFNITQY